MKVLFFQGLGIIVNIWNGNNTKVSSIFLENTEARDHFNINISAIPEVDLDATISLQSFLTKNLTSSHSEKIRIHPLALSLGERNNRFWLILGISITIYKISNEKKTNSRYVKSLI